MKQIILSSLAILFILAAGCKKDNYEAPAATLTGQVVYNKQPLGLRSNGVQLELWQRGFELYTKIPVYVSQDGTFSASLFDGDYKLVLLRGNGPWASNTDSIDVSVRGSATVEVPVDPYFIISNATFARNGNEVTATFSLQRVNTSLPLESVSVYLGANNIVDNVNNAASATRAASAIPDITQPISLSISIPAALASRQFIYARVGVKTAGVSERLFTMPEQIALQ